MLTTKNIPHFWCCLIEGIASAESSPPSSSAPPTATTDSTVFIPETMAEEDPKPLNYILEIILKKRKSSEALALEKKDQLQQKKFQTKNSKDYIKKPEDFIIEYRNKITQIIGNLDPKIEPTQTTSIEKT